LLGHLRVLLAESDVERAAILEQRLREISGAVILRMSAGGTLLDAVTAQDPDVIIVYMHRPERDRLDDLHRVGSDNTRPVVMLVDREDPAFMEEAIAVGVTSYATLMERDTVNRAKSMLMKQRNIDEPRAYRWLRRRAMNGNRRIVDVAAELLAKAGEDKPGS